eukprot:7869157-Pyramimonas_sp.AAC.1
MRPLDEQLWAGAAEHYMGTGLEKGADCQDMRGHLRRLRKQSEHQRYGALPTAACAGTWTRS